MDFSAIETNNKMKNSVNAPISLPSLEEKTLIPVNMHNQTLSTITDTNSHRMLSRKEVKRLQAWLSLLGAVSCPKELQKIYPQISGLVAHKGSPGSL
jgi:hypothetical protein